MSYKVISQDVIETHPTQYGIPQSCSSTIEEIYLDETMLYKQTVESSASVEWPVEWQTSKWLLPSKDLFTMFKVDVSSTYPLFEPRNRSSLIKEFDEGITPEEVPEEILEYDVFVRFLPVKEYTIKLKIKSMEKATPRIVEP